MRSIVLIISVLGAMLAAGTCVAEEKLDFQDARVRLGYSIGYLTGDDFLRQQWELNPDMVLRGIADAQGRSAPLLPPEQMRRVLAELQKVKIRQQFGEVKKKANPSR